MSPAAAAREPGGAYLERYLAAQDGLSLYYRDYGPRRCGRAAALCLPGLTRNSRDFEPLATRLAPSRRVLCPDYRGRGRSDYDPDWRNYEPAVYLNDLRHLLVANNVHEVVAIGTSLGGGLAMGLAVMIPTVVRGVVLNDIGPEVDAGGLRRIFETVAGIGPQPDWAAAVREVRRRFPMLSLKSEESWLAFARATFRDAGDGVLRPDWDPNLLRPWRGAPPPDLWTLYRGLGRLPALAIRGGESDLLTVPVFARMKAEKPDLMQVTVPGVGHAPSLSEPESWAAIESFLAGF